MIKNRIFGTYLKLAIWVGIIGATSETVGIPVSGIGGMVVAASILMITFFTNGLSAKIVRSPKSEPKKLRPTRQLLEASLPIPQNTPAAPRQQQWPSVYQRF